MGKVALGFQSGEPRALDHDASDSDRVHCFGDHITAPNPPEERAFLDIACPQPVIQRAGGIPYYGLGGARIFPGSLVQIPISTNKGWTTFSR